MTQRRIYQNEYPYFITFRTRESYLLFEDINMAELLFQEIFVSARIKHYDILAFQIMPDHIHLLVYVENQDRTLESVLSEGINYGFPSSNGCISTERISTERTFSKVRSHIKKKYNISDLIQSIKGNFSRKLHMGKIWQPRFYTRVVSTRKYLYTVIEYIKYNPIKAELPIKYSKEPYQYFSMVKNKKPR